MKCKSFEREVDLIGSRQWRTRRWWWRNGGNRGRWSFRRLSWMEGSDRRRGTGASPTQWCQCSSSIDLRISATNCESIFLSLSLRLIQLQHKQGETLFRLEALSDPQTSLLGSWISGPFKDGTSKLELLCYNSLS